MRKKSIRSRHHSEEKRRYILRAAVAVFAQKGYHRCRIADIASRAQVAYGLVYHYFKNKEELLNTLFEENWGLLNGVIDSIAAERVPLRQKVQRLVGFILDAYRLAPDVIQVMVIEVARSAKLLSRPRLEMYEKSFARLGEVFADHQRRGEIRPELDCRLLAYGFFGMIELVLTGYLLKMIEPVAGEQIEALRERLTDMFLRGVQ